jgi:hypothetical protein
MRRWRNTLCIVLMLAGIAPASLAAATSFFWFECPFAARVGDVKLEGATETPRMTITFDVLFVTFKRGFMAGKAKKCGFDKGDTITARNYASDKEGAEYAARQRSLTRQIKIDRAQLALLQPGDRVKILYKYFNADDGDREVWEFLGVTRR